MKTFSVPGRKPVLALFMRLLLAALLVLPTFGAEAAVVLTTLHSFNSFPNGEAPNRLVQGNDGNFYGTTFRGGTNVDNGTVFKMSTNGTLTSLYSFTGGNDGSAPAAGLVQGSDGNFYGTTIEGGTNGFNGTVFKITPYGALTSLYSFRGGNDGGFPAAALVLGSDGDFYGTTTSGGTNGGNGTVFKINPNGALTTLYAFGTVTNAMGYPLDGANPTSGLVQGSDGNFYGTTQKGGTFDWGTVFKISANGALTSLHLFGFYDGGYPDGGLVQGSDGNFYGTTYYGGDGIGLYGLGTVFKISPNGALTSLYSFTGGNDGEYPGGPLVQGSDGSFYDTTSNGSTNGGTVFKISPSGALNSLYSFTGGNDGAYPETALVQGSDGNFYGTTYDGGTSNCGTVFKMSANGTLTSLYSFTGGIDGANPETALVQASDGNFYGTINYGGTSNSGTVFKISADGALTSLYSFTGGNDGANPGSSLVQGSDGNFYGTTTKGGTNGGNGTVFKISADGALTSLYSFTGGNDGGYPYGALVQGSDGNFYGTASGYNGSVFMVSTNGVLTSLISFNVYDGAGPNGLVQGSDGSFYGTTFTDVGTVFKISTIGTLRTLYSFTDRNDGGYPFAALVQGSDGNFYGTTSTAGQGGAGTVFRLTIVPEFQAVTLTNSTLRDC